LSRQYYVRENMLKRALGATEKSPFAFAANVDNRNASTVIQLRTSTIEMPPRLYNRDHPTISA